MMYHYNDVIMTQYILIEAYDIYYYSNSYTQNILQSLQYKLYL